MNELVPRQAWRACVAALMFAVVPINSDVFFSDYRRSGRDHPRTVLFGLLSCVHALSSHTTKTIWRDVRRRIRWMPPLQRICNHIAGHAAQLRRLEGPKSCASRSNRIKGPFVSVESPGRRACRERCPARGISHLATDCIGRLSERTPVELRMAGQFEFTSRSSWRFSA